MTPYSFRKEVIGTPEAGGPFIAHAYTDAGIFWQYSVEGSECGLKFDDLPPGYTDQWRRARKVCVRRRKVSRNSSKSTAVKVRPVLRHLDATRDGTFAELSRIACIAKRLSQAQRHRDSFFALLVQIMSLAWSDPFR